MCWYCGTPVWEEESRGRSFRCLSCGKDLRSCRNCRLYLPGGRGDCSEAQAEPPSDKERGNFCDWFSLNPRFRTVSAGEKRLKEEAAFARSAFDDLFN